jgi:hypothetical protein
LCHSTSIAKVLDEFRATLLDVKMPALLPGAIIIAFVAPVPVAVSVPSVPVPFIVPVLNVNALAGCEPFTCNVRPRALSEPNKYYSL